MKYEQIPADFIAAVFEGFVDNYSSANICND